MKISKFWLNWLIVLTIILSSISFPQTAYAEGGKDVSSILQEKTIRALQGGTLINDGGNIDANKPITFEVNFKVPSKNDKPKPSQYVKYDDYAKIELGEGFILPAESAQLKDIKIKGRNEKIGSYQFAIENGKLVLKVKFDATDKNIFESNEFSDIRIKASGSFEIDKSGIGEDGKELSIFGSTFKIILPPIFTVAKKGEVDKTTHNIKWTIDVTGKRGETHIDLKDYILDDNLSKTGAYVDGSFKVNGATKTPVNKNNSLSYTFPQGSVSPIQITFETKLTNLEFRGSNSAKNKTELIKSNEVSLKDKNNTQRAQDKTDVKWIPDFLEKSNKWYHRTTGKELTAAELESNSGNVVDYYKTPEGKYRIVWDIYVNQEEATLKNVVVRDLIPKGNSIRRPLKFVEAKFEKWNGATWENSNIISHTQEQDINVTQEVLHKFELGDLNKKAKLTIVTEVDGDISETYYSRFTNVAFVGWDGLSWKRRYDNEYISTWDSAVIGKGGIRKRGTDDKNDPYYQPTDTISNFAGRINKWVVTTTVNPLPPNAKVYDLMIFDNSITTINWRSGLFEIDDSGKHEITKETLNGLTTDLSSLKYNKYIGEFDNFGKSEITHNVYKVYAQNKYVADLLVVKGFNDNARKFSFVSSAESPELFLHDNITNQSYNPIGFNRAYLASDDRLLDYEDSWTTHKVKMLDKRVVSASNAELFYADKNISHINADIDQSIVVKHVPRLNSGQTLEDYRSAVKEALKAEQEKLAKQKSSLKEKAFNQKDNSILYRLSLNADGHQSTSDILGTITVKDTLPEGWEFVNFENGKPYMSFRGHAVKGRANVLEETISTDARVIADEEIDLSSMMNYTLSQDKKDLTLSFTNMTEPYVVLLKVKPTKETLIKNAMLNKYTISNTATMKSSVLGETPGRMASDSQDTEVINKVVNKVITNATGEKGILKWSVDYKPNEFVQKADPSVDLYLEDTLSKGIELVQTNGKPKVKIEQVEFGPNGEVISSNPLTNSSDLVEYDKNTRILKLKIENHEKSYRFSYETNILSESGVTVSNKVRLVGSNLPNSNSDPINHLVSDADVEASLKINAWLKIKKKDAKTSAILEGAEFTLTSENGQIVEVETTGRDGELIFNSIEDGKYDLKETKAPSGYSLNSSKVYKVVVNKSTPEVVTVDGIKTNIIEVTNDKTEKGALVITNKVLVEDKTGDKTGKDFVYTVTFENDNNKYSYEKTDLNGLKTTHEIRSGKTIELKHGERAEIKDLPLGSKYTVRQNPENNYTTTHKIDAQDDTQAQEKNENSREITANNRKPEEHFINTSTGTLTITNEIDKEANVGDKTDKYFEYTVEFSDNGSYLYEKANQDGSSTTGTISSGKKLPLLKANEKIVIKDLPIDTIYTVKQIQDPQYDTYVSPDRTTINLVASGQITQVEKHAKEHYINTSNKPTPPVEKGTLTISNEIDNVADGDDKQTKDFDFTVIFENNPNSYNYEITDKDNNIIPGQIKSGDTIKLKHNEKIVIKDLPMDTKYTVTEVTDPKYETSHRDENGNITPGKNISSGKIDEINKHPKEHFINTAKTLPPQSTTGAMLQIFKETIGTGLTAQRINNDIFTFRIDFDKDMSAQYDFIKSDGESGKIQSGEPFTLMAGQNIIIKDIPNGERYTLTETDYKDYTPQDITLSGDITTAQALNIVKFVNKIDAVIEYGSLRITNAVTGNESDPNKKFKFTIVIGNDPTKEYYYDGFGGVPGGKLKTGDVIELTHGQSIIIKDIPVGTEYSVTEDNEDYTKTSTGETGTIVVGEKLAEFINTKNSSGGSSSGGGSGGGGGDTPKIPSVPDREQPKQPEQPEQPKQPEQPQQPEQPRIPDSNTKPPTGIPFNPTEIIGNIPQNDRPVLTIVDENGVPIGKAEVDLNEGTYVFIEDERVPEGVAKIYNNNVLEILEDETPKSTPKKILSKRTLPKTGSDQGYYYIMGLMLLGIGLVLRKRKKK